MKKNHILIASLLTIALLCVSALLPACSCGSDSGDEDGGTNGTGDTGFKVTGSLSGAAAIVEAAAASTFTASDFYYDPPPDGLNQVPDSANGGTSANSSPEGYTVALKTLTLLGDDSTDDYEGFSAEAVEDAYIADFVNDTTFFDSETYPDPGTYEGIEMEVFYIEMEIEVYIPRLNYALEDSTYTFTSDVYTMRGYFDTVGDIEPRDVTVFWDDPDDDPDAGEQEYWIDRQMDHDTPFGLVSVDDEERPWQTFDLWADENFWGRDPVTISTSEEFRANFGTGFDFELAEGTEDFTIPEDPEGVYEVAFEFDVQETLTWWEYLEEVDGAVDTESADGLFALGFDSGYRFFFPRVMISMEEPST